MGEKDFYVQDLEIGAGPEKNQESRPAKKGGGFLEFVVILLVAFALVFGFVRPFVLEAFYIPSESMVPTLEVGDRVFVNKFVYRFAEPERGDVVVFRSVEGENEDLIKRVVALPGETVHAAGGRVYVDGRLLVEPYLPQATRTSDFAPVKVPAGHLWVMGDNRSRSFDSRFVGPVERDTVVGRAVLKIWPPARASFL